jgi:phosphate transport system permease protein
MSSVLAPPARPPATSRLQRRSLPRWATPAIAVGAVTLSLLFAFVRGSKGLIPVTVLAYVFFLAGVVVSSAVVESGRRARDRLATVLVIGAFGTALAPLLAVLGVVISRGAARFDLEFFTHSLRGVGPTEAGGGAYHAIVATLEQVALASAFAVPVGILVAIYLVEYGRGAFARTTSYVVDVMTGLPSVVAGLFILAFFILYLQHGRGFSGFAGAMALGILMLPIVVRSTEEMLKLVPDGLREASYALGVPRWRTIVSIVIPTALPGIVTGVMLGVARIFGETAPILLVTFGTDSINLDPFHGPQSSLPLFVFQQASQPNPTAIDRAWTGALTLILIVMILNLTARLVARRAGARGR